MNLVKIGMINFLMRSSYVLLSFLLSVVLARTLGAKEYGLYSFVFILASFISIPSQFGISKLLIRETAKYRTWQDWFHLKGLWYWSFYFSLIIAFILVILFYLIRSKLNQPILLAHGLVLLIVILLLNFFKSCLNGQKYTIISQLPDHLIRPALMIILIYYLSFHFNINTIRAIQINIIAAFIGLCFLIYFFFKFIPDGLKGQKKGFKSKEWLQLISTFSLTGGMQALNQYTDILMLSFFSSPEQVGIYRIAVQIAMMIVFGLSVVDMFISPYLSGYFAAKDMQKIDRLIKKTGQFIFAIALPLFLFFLFFGQIFISFVFGQEYAEAYYPLLILSFGHLINASFGTVGYLLNMTKHEQSVKRSTIIAALSNFVLNLFLIPYFGMIGAAIATMSTLFIWNISLWRQAKHHLNINTFILK